MKIIWSMENQGFPPPHVNLIWGRRCEQLRELGLTNVILTDHCYVYGLLPATEGCQDCPAVGFISHMDTAPDFPGKDVKPQCIADYDGGDVLLSGSGAYLKTSDFPSLKSLKGRTLITTDGTTLLGADDKAGIAEILTAVGRSLPPANRTETSGSALRGRGGWLRHKSF